MRKNTKSQRKVEEAVFVAAVNADSPATNPEVKLFPASVSSKVGDVTTHEGGATVPPSPLGELHRAVLACLLWEDTFYESGVSIADRIKGLVHQCAAQDVASLAIDARSRHNLRHVPLLLARELARHKGLTKSLVADLLPIIIKRADEITEFLAIYWAEEKQSISKQVKRGLAKAFAKFDEYQLAKYNRKTTIRLKDVLFMVHAKPKDEAQAQLWKRLADDQLATPDTWEVGLSGGADKRETFERLLGENKLGYLALLRNLRNMTDAGVNRELIKSALLNNRHTNILPFRFISAAKAAPSLEPELDQAMVANLKNHPKLGGNTIVLVDVSGSMINPLSSKSKLKRMDAATGIAILIAAIAEQVKVYSFSEKLVEIPPREGMALADAIRQSQPNHGTYLFKSLSMLDLQKDDRLIVITDEQAHDQELGEKQINASLKYIINVGSYQNGVDYGGWIKVNGFSESVVSFIQALEKEQLLK